MKKIFAGLVAGAVLGSAALVWAQTNVPISQLPPVPVLSGSEVFPIVKNGITYKATPDQVRAVMGSPVNGTWTGTPIGSAYGGAGSINGILKANGLGAVSLAVSGVNYAPATTGASILSGNSAGGFTNVSVGTGLSFSGGTLSSTVTGTVTSVGLTAPSFLTVSGSPVTGSGTLALSLTSQAQNLFLASPTGSTGTPTMRAIASADLSGSFTGITGVGSVTTGTWQATAIATGFGGLGLNNSAASGVPLFASGVVTMTSTSGTGNFARVTSPAFVTPDLGTPSAVNLANATNLPVASLTGQVSGANGGTGVANSGKTITIGANLATTGAGATTLAFGASTQTYTFPTTTATLARTDAAQTFTGTQTFGAVDASSVGATTPGTGKFTTLQATGTLTTNITGSTQCLQVNSSGVVSGTGCPTNPATFRMTRATSNATGISASNGIAPFNNTSGVGYDPGGLCNTSTGVCTVATTGKWHFDFTVLAGGNLVASNFFIATLFKNGVVYAAFGPQIAFTTTGGLIYVSGSADVNMTSGDTIDIRLSHGVSSGTLTLYSSVTGGDTFFDGHYVGP